MASGMTDGGSINYSVLVKRQGEELLTYLKDPESRVFTCTGWKGIGRWRIAEYATSMAMKSHLFDVLIWLNLPRNDFKKRWNQQMRIAEILGIQAQTTETDYDSDTEGTTKPDYDSDTEGEIDMPTSTKIYEKLEGRKFLLVVGGALSEISKPIDLLGIGVPNLWRRPRSGSKIVYVGRWMNTPYFKEIGISSYTSTFSGDPSSDSLWDLICEEAGLVAHSPATQGYFSRDTVLDCLMYFSLSFNEGYYYSFSQDKEWMIRYMIAEDFIGGEMEDNVLKERVRALLTELEDRSFLHWQGSVVNIKEEVMKIIRQDMDGQVANFHHKFWIKSDSLPEEDEWQDYERMSLLITSREGFNTNLPPSPKCLNLSTLIFRSDPDHHLEFPPAFFHHMESLKVLDLAHMPIKFLPFSLSSLCNLKLLMLQGCKKLESLPTSLHALSMLEFLDLSHCLTLKVIPEESFKLMDKLQILDLSEMQIHSLPSSISNLRSIQKLLLRNCSKLTSIPEDCFGRMSHLNVLDLSYATSLESLPSSLSSLVNLKNLNLSNCKSLKIGVLQSLQNLTSLEVLDLSYCEKLEDIKDASFQNILPKLQQVCISNTPAPKQLSFKGCKSIETLDLGFLENLEVLDLSGTKLKTLNLSVSSSYPLKRLDILPIWYSDNLFEELNWGDVDDAIGARIWVSDLGFFQTTTASYSGRFSFAPCFSRFYIRISPCDEEQGCLPMTMDKIQNIHLQRSPCPSFYKGIYYSHNQTHLFPHFRNRRAYPRHVEICGSGWFRLFPELFMDSIAILLHQVRSLTCDHLDDLKECRIGCCGRMDRIFNNQDPTFIILPSLEVIWGSDLPQLTAVCKGYVYGAESFKLLKHIFLEHCPRLATLFSSGVYLKSLETLEIRFCSMLECIFQQETSDGQGSLQSLRSLNLLQVPKLKSVYNGFLPKLENVRVQRCTNLRKLPFQVHLIGDDINGGSSYTSSSVSMIEIRGEMAWWKNLEWGDEDDSIKRPARFRPWKHSPTTLRRR